MTYSPFFHAASVLHKSQPIHLTIFLTRRCNGSCPFCFYLRSTSHYEMDQELSLDELADVSRSFGRLLWLAFSGGEIYLRSELPEIVSTFYKNNRPSIILLPTNGLLPDLIFEQTEKILKTCRNSIITVKLSIDGIDKAHDQVRNAPGSFEKTMNTYRLLSDLLDRYPHFELGVNTVFCSDNQDYMDEIISYVATMKKIGTHTISLVRGSLIACELKDVDHKKYLAAISRLETDLKGKGSRFYRFKGARLKAAQDIIQRKLISRTIEEQKRLIPCYAGMLNLVISETGDVFPCEIRTESFGNVRDYGYNVKRVLKSNKAKQILASISGKKCHCTHECYFMTNILFNPALYPRLFGEYLQLSR